MMTERSGRSIVAPGPKDVTTCPRRSAPTPLRAIARPALEQKHFGFHVPHGSRGLEPRARGAELRQAGLQRIVEQGLGPVHLLILLILESGGVVALLVGDLAPIVQQLVCQALNL